MSMRVSLFQVCWIPDINFLNECLSRLVTDNSERWFQRLHLVYIRQLFSSFSQVASSMISHKKTSIFHFASPVFTTRELSSVLPDVLLLTV